MGRNKSAILGFLKEKLYSKIRSWDGKHIVRSGKEVLIKSVVQALPTYAMNVLLLPLEITRDIEKSLSKFWWNSKQSGGSHISWMAWERIEKRKSAGGLWFRNFRDFNLAMGKQGWIFITNPDSLTSRTYKARYFPGSDFLNSTMRHNQSFIWRSIFEAKQLVLDGVRWRNGSSDNIKILGQPWLPDDNNPFITTVSTMVENKNLSSPFCTDKKDWDIDISKDVFNSRDQNCIMDIQ